MSKIRIFGVNQKQIGQLLSVTDEEASPSTEPRAQTGGSSRQPGSLEGKGTQIGRYRLTGVLGEGGMGIVYLAEQEHPIKRQVALKVIKPGMDSRRVIARFEAERQALALLDHPNIAHVHDAGTTDIGRPYFVMEHVAGLPITEYSDRNKLSIEDRLDLFRQVCDGVHHAHQRGIIHRDIKASNILVTLKESKAIPKIIDFGVARAIHQSLTGDILQTEQGQLLGTPEYMSPEQVNLGSENVDVRTDVYSLGVLLYVLLTGVLPFDAERLRKGGIDTVRQILLEEDPKTPSACIGDLAEKAKEIAENRRTQARSLTKRLRGELEWIALKAMNKERDHRYQSAAELAQDIRNYLSGTPLMAGPPGSLYRLGKCMRRHRTLVSAIFLVGLTVIVGSAVSTVMYFKAEVQAQRSRAIGSFLNNSVLEALNPNRARGGQITAISVLDSVSDALDDRFEDAPVVEASVRYKVGATYQRQGEYVAAGIHLQRALDICRAELGADHENTVASMLELAHVLRRQGRVDEAEPLYLEGIAGRTRRLGGEASATLYAKMKLAENFFLMGEHDETLRLSREVLTTARRAGGDAESMIWFAMQMIGWVHVERGQYETAERWFREGLLSAEQVAGPNHSIRASLESCVGVACVLKGDYPQAERILQEACTRCRRIYGAHHPTAHAYQEFLIRLYVAWGKPQEAEKLYAELRDTRVHWAAERGQQSGVPENRASLAGSMRYDEVKDTYTIIGSGMDVWHVFDEFHFAHKALRGDGGITAKVDRVEHVDWMTKAGVMIRRTLGPTSEHASVYMRPGGVVEFRYRTSDRAGVLSRSTCIRNLKLPHWVRLDRRGNAFTAYHASDGKDWEEVGGQDPNQHTPVMIEMDDAAHIGLIVTSEDPGRAAEAKMSNVTLTGDVDPPGEFLWSKDIGFQMIALPK
jgi:serine/threonine protein kinase